MTNRGKRWLSILMLVMMLATTPGLMPALAETATLMGDFSVTSTIYPVRFYHINSTGQYVLYEEDGFANPQMVEEGKLPALPSGYPDENPGYSFLRWDARATLPVTGTTNVYATYEPIGTVMYTVEFVRDDGTTVGDSFHAVVKAGDSISQTLVAPVLQGYHPQQDEAVAGITFSPSGDGGVVSIQVAKATEDTVYRVVYVPNAPAGYFVEHHVENAAGKYDLLIREPMQGPLGSIVRPVAKELEGYTLKTDLTAILDRVQPGNQTTVRLEYDRNAYGVYYDVGTKGVWPSGAANPVVVKYGDPIPTSVKPTRAGYDFDGWRFDGNYQTMPGHEVLATAVWKPSQAKYQVFVWGQSEKKNPATGLYDEYTVLDTIEKTGNTESILAFSPSSHPYTHFTFSHHDQNVRLEGDGTTILNVYYSRNEYTLSFRTSSTSSVFFTLTAKYKENIQDRYSSGGFPSEYMNVQWVNQSGVYTVTPFVMPGENRLLTYAPAKGKYTATAEMFFQNLLSNGTPNTVLKSYPLGNKYVSYQESYGGNFVISRDLNKGYELYQPSVTWDGDGKAKIPKTTVAAYTMYNALYFNLLKYDVIYHDRGRVYEVQQYYTGSLNGYGNPAKLSDVVAGYEGYTFDGWYASQNLEGERYVFDGRTMPYTNIAVYAKWLPPIFTVTFDAGVGAPTPAAQQVRRGEFVRVPTPPSHPTRTFEGWYVDAQLRTRYLFSTPVSGDMTLYAKYSGVDVVPVTVYHVDEKGKTLHAPTYDEGTLGQTITVYPMDIAGYLPYTRAQDVRLANVNGESITFVYTPMKAITYTVYYKDAANPQVDLLPPKKVTIPTTQSSAIITEVREIIPGYTADAVTKTLHLVYPVPNEITFYYKSYSSATTYSVVLHIERNTLDGFDVSSPTEKTADLGAYVKEVPLQLSGYEYSEDLSTAEGVVLSGGRLQLDMYYLICRYSYSVEHINLKTGRVIHSAVRTQIPYNKEVTETSLTAPNLTYLYYEMGGSTGGSTSVTTRIRDNKTVIRFYYNVKYSISASAEGGTITPGTTLVDEGENITFTYKPDDGYTLSEVIIDGTPVPNPDPDRYTFTNVTGDHEIKVVFTRDQTPLVISALPQRYVYNGKPQGVVGQELTGDMSQYIHVEGLEAGHAVEAVYLDGEQQTNAGVYPDALWPVDARIVDGSGKDVTGQYDISYDPGTLIIFKKGNGQPDPNNPGAELPMVITAADQVYTYTGGELGTVGKGLYIDTENPLVTGVDLVPGHRISVSDINGTPKVQPGTYANALMPDNAKIISSTYENVTDNYLITEESYKPGNLIIRKLGEENPVVITAADQKFVYNGEPQGNFGAGLAVQGATPVATATGLMAGHRLANVTLSGAQQTVPGVYGDTIIPSGAKIVDASSNDVTSLYHFGAQSYVAGDLTIFPKGNGKPDPDQPGAELPFEVHAQDQTYTYDGTPKGIVGNDLTNDNDALAWAVKLVPGHKLSVVSIGGSQQTSSGTYANTLIPSGAKIVDAKGIDVTAHYRIDEATSYYPGTLKINPMGDGNPVVIRALEQRYVYNDSPQGVVGQIAIAKGERSDYVQAEGLLAGHYLAQVTLGGQQKTYPDTYAGLLVPSKAKILDANGKDVTGEYTLGVDSYVAADLIIFKKGNGKPDPNTPGAELPMEVKAADQSFVYNGEPQGTFGERLPVNAANPLASATALVDGHRLTHVTLTGDQRTIPGTDEGAIVPTAVRIVNGSGQDVTDHYLFNQASNTAGNLTIFPKGNGKPDPDQPGAELPLDVYAQNQTYTYDGTPKGIVGDDLTNDDDALAYAVKLVPGHKLSVVTIGGSQQTSSGTYANTLIPSSATIVDAKGIDVTAYYRIEGAKSYHPGTLQINPMGGETPIVIRALDQRYVYNAAAQGVVGTITLAQGERSPYVEAEGLLAGHYLAEVFIGGSAKVDPDTYTGLLAPNGARIVDASGANVTHEYTFGAGSYVAGDLIIYQKGNGKPDPDLPGAELPMDITAADQHFIYNGKPQGTFGDKLPVTGENPLASAVELLDGHRLANVTLTGTPQALPGTYGGEVTPTGVIIVDVDGKDVTNKYRIVPESYTAGDLIIHKKGNGQPDGNGGELPMEIYAQDQTYPYDGTPKGVVGTALDNSDHVLATAVELVPGHKLSVINIAGDQQTSSGTYKDTLIPSGAKIVDENGDEVTSHYLIVDGKSYYPGTLQINPMGSGNPVVIRALEQRYVYNEAPQGVVGTLHLAKGERSAYVQAEGLLTGHYLAEVMLGGEQKTDPDTYKDLLVPSGAKIFDADGKDVTAEYTFGADSYVAADLVIFKKGNGKPDPDQPGAELPMEVRAADQHFIYNGEPQGTFGAELPVGTAKPLASAVELLTGHRLEAVTLTGTRQTKANVYPGAVVPTAVKIVDAGGNDVTDKYLLGNDSFYAGDLIIHKKGNGQPDGNGGELPMDIYAQNQTYTYDGTPKGVFGTGLNNVDNTLATAVQLVPDHTLSVITIGGTEQVASGTYKDSLIPSGAKIVDKDGADVTANYLIVAGDSYHPGTLQINPVGAENPVVIRALDQHYVYNETEQGVVGTLHLEAGEQSPYVVAEGLLTGHYLAEVVIGGSAKTEPNTYTDLLMPKDARIFNAEGQDVTGEYVFGAGSYVAADLIIHKKGNGQPDPDKPGAELPMEVRAADQHFIYNGTERGTFGEKLPVGATSPLATAVELVEGHRLANVTLEGTPQILPDTYADAIIPTGVRIVNASGKDVTDRYLLTAESYFAGDLIIHKKGNGQPDGKGGELPMDIYAKDQVFPYDGTPKGIFGTGLDNAGDTRAWAMELVPGHALSAISLDGNQQTEEGTYQDALMPSGAKIVDASGADVTKNYLITEGGSYHPGTLRITPREAQNHLVVRALDQHYVYNEKPQGVVGIQTMTATEQSPYVRAEGLLTGHYLAQATLGGNQETEPDVYAGTLVPSGAKILDQSGKDVTNEYIIDADTYIAADLVIHKKGNGKPDPDQPGAELPMEVTAANQTYVYNGQSQGVFGDVTITAENPLASAVELIEGHSLKTVALDGAQRTNPGDYAGAIVPTGVVIVNASGEVVTDKYLLTPESYIAGDLTIYKKGNGQPDPDKPGAELPMDVYAQKQTYVYNGQPQGAVGSNLLNTGDKLAYAIELVDGHVLQRVSLDGNRQTQAGEYPGTLMPTGVTIVDVAGIEVTDYYLLTSGSYHAGDLVITKKGNGEPDPDKPGEELPLEVTATAQRYIYNGEPQGVFGNGLLVSAAAPVATAEELVSGHRLHTVTLSGNQQTLPGTYGGAIMPSVAKIVDAQGRDVTANYRLDESLSYFPGDLYIAKKGSGDPDPDNPGEELPLVVTASDQHFTYNGKPQGTFGTGLPVTGPDPLATAIELVPGHRIEHISLAGDQQTDADTYADAITPSAVRIVDAAGANMTDYYRIEDSSYRPGDLIIHKKGSGDPDPDEPGEELPLVVTASDQHYIYNGQPQGVFGAAVTNDPNAPVATARALADGHRIASVDLTGDQQTKAGQYPASIQPSEAKIVSAGGQDVTKNYRLEDESYVPGALIIHKKGNGQPDGKGGELPLEITAANQRYIFNGQPQGVFGENLTNDLADPYATAIELVPDHSIKTVSLFGVRRTPAGLYEKAITPRDVVIIDEEGIAVTENYLITESSYYAGDLYIAKKGNGEPDPENPGEELPLTVTAADQTFVYNGQPQGDFGDKLLVDAAKPRAQAETLAVGHRLQWVSLDGQQQTDAGEYADAVMPTAVRIVNAAGQDQTANYRIEDTSYIAGKLTIFQKGNGQPDPDGSGRELPLMIQAAKQVFDYTGGLHGIFGDNLTLDAQNQLATAVELVSGQRLAVITLTGDQQSEVGDYDDAIAPSAAKIETAAGADVTRNYRIEASSYLPGTLVIQPVGGSQVLIRARDQHYTYNETPQGIVGAITLDGSEADPLVTAEGLLTGHRLAGATLGGQQQTEPAVYTDELLPSGAKIVDAQGNDVTSQYNLTDANYVAGDLVIHKKGNGKPDPDRPGAELPMEITAVNQTYVYNGMAQGIFGASLENSAQSPLATAVELLPGHTLETVSLLGAQQVDPAVYPDAIRPVGVKIVDANGKAVTDKYLITEDSYIPGDLIIYKKGSGEPDPDQPGAELPMEITAADQHFVYNGKPQGDFGTGMSVKEPNPLATAVQLVPGHRLETVTLYGTQHAETGTYADAVAAMQAKIVDAAGRDVTDKYLITEDSYIPGDLIIHKKGNGVPDGNGGEEPLEVTAEDQHYVYNGEPQGETGDRIPHDENNPLVDVVELVPGHTIEYVSIDGDPQTDPALYPDHLNPTEIKIVDENGDDVTEHYNIVPDSFRPGDLVIHEKGNGEPDPDNPGGELPLEITAIDQHFVYNGLPQGDFGDELVPTQQNPLAEVVELVPGHRLAEITLIGQKQTAADTYADAIMPRKAVIVDQNGVDVTEKYNIVPASYFAGDLIIHKKGNGDPDPDNPGGELPLDVTAIDQHFVYNGQPQGTFGEELVPDPSAPLVETKALVPGHSVGKINLWGQQRTETGEYIGAITPADARIFDAQGQEVTDNYLLTPKSYHKGDLTIHKKGNGDPDPDNPGGELPLEITASDQTYIYNGQAQGVFGKDIPVDRNDPLATARQLAPGHSIQTVSLLGQRQTDAGVYANSIDPTDVIIVDASGRDVTKHYNIDRTSYFPGTLTIHKKGNGQPDPNNPGQELPVDVTAADQHFVYSGAPQGDFGEDIAVRLTDPQALAEQLVSGHRLKTVTLTGTQRILPATYADEIMPSRAQIVDAAGKNVTDNYRLEASGYHAGDLTIHKKGNGEPDPDNPGGELPLEVTANDQNFEYDGTPKGIIGDDLPVSEDQPLARAVALVPGHSIAQVSIEGNRETEAGTYPDTLTPTKVKIVDDKGGDVTAYYNLATYWPGTLTIRRAGEGAQVTITASNQTYVYNEAYQGIVGRVQVSPQDANPLATAQGLLFGHRLEEVTIDGDQQIDPGVYADTLMPHTPKIVDGSGKDVTYQYDTDTFTYVAGTLTIHKKGNGKPDPEEPGKELPLDVTAEDQTYIYNGKPQGVFGTDLPNDPDAPLAVAVELLPGHSISVITLTGDQETKPGTYEDRISPSGVRIVDAQGQDVTDKYLLDDSGYHVGDLIIHKKGNGQPDPDIPGAELPMVVTASDQSYVYNGRPQGLIDSNLRVTEPNPVATAVELVPGHRLNTVTIVGTQRTDVGEYPAALSPMQARIVDAGGADVTDCYRLEDTSYVAGKLTITPKGNGQPDPDKPGEELPLDITAATQHFVYSGAPQGTFGTDLAVTQPGGLAGAVALVPGHRLVEISLTGQQRVDPDTYVGAIKPSGAMIVDAAGEDVTGNYKIESSSYHAGDLIIHKKGNGIPDGNGGELPAEITAADQRFIYNGKPQGTFGDRKVNRQDAPLATGIELIAGHRIAWVSLAGNQETEAGTYENVIWPTDVQIVDARGADVTSKYLITEDSFFSGDLIIAKKGNGIPDGNGGEEPMVITAVPQEYIYSGQPQGHFGDDLPVTADQKLVTAVALAPGHRVESASLDGTQRTDAGTYPDAIEPTGIRIVDAAGEDVTHNYLITDGSFRPGDLIIHKKGNGTPDPDGGELPLDVYAADQTYIYNGKPQGLFGADIAVDAAKPQASANGLVGGHRLSEIALLGTAQTLPANYPGAIRPAAAVIVNAAGEDVTDNYRLTRGSYHAGDLIIHKKGNGVPDGNGGEEPMVITAEDQTYIYNGKPQGIVGANLTVVDADPLATGVQLVPGHRIAKVSIDGSQQTGAKVYPDSLKPVSVIIVDASGQDVTDCYLIEKGSYLPGTLTIYPKGNGVPDPDGGEEPLEVTAANQTYLYNDAFQGEVGENLLNTDEKVLATAVSLASGHRISRVSIDGARQRDVGVYKDTLKPTGVRIVDERQRDVTENYRLDAGSYFPGTLEIKPIGAELGVTVTASEQRYVYNEQPQGVFGQVTIRATDKNPLATAEGLLFGHRLARVSLDGTQQTEPDTYTDAIVPSDAQILDAAGRDVTSAYALTARQYIAGDLVIYKKGSGDPDPDKPGAELPLKVIAADQSFVYNGQAQGNFGLNMDIDEADPIAKAIGLLPGHTLTSVTLVGDRQTNAGKYPGAVAPLQAKIVNAAGQDVTEKYLLDDATSYIAGDLTIHKKGNGQPDPEGGEKPVVIQAGDQRYVYNGEPQGQFGQDLPVSAENPLATIEELVPGERLANITLKGTPKTNPDTYPGAISPDRARIVDAAGKDVTDNYNIVPESYLPGTLIIDKKGNGNPDPDGGEEPLDVWAEDQTYIYNGKPQGITGNNLRAESGETKLARAVGLLPGHRLHLVSIRGSQQTDAGEYRDALEPTGVFIVDAAGRDVTDKYKLDRGSYHEGDLVIKPKGNGQPDGNGGEHPLVIQATDQMYVYNGQPQGEVGRNLAVTEVGPLAKAKELVPGERLQTITISGNKQKEVGVYPESLMPSEAKIVNAAGHDVTRNYRIEGSSYEAGNLVIRKSDAVYVLSIHHVDTAGKVINVPTITVHMAGETYGYAPLNIRDYRAVRATILHGGVVEKENAPLTATGQVMPDADVSVVITYESTLTTPTQSPGTSPTTSPTAAPTMAPGASPTAGPGGVNPTVNPSVPTAAPTRAPGSGGTGQGQTPAGGGSTGTGSGGRSSLISIMDDETPLQGYTNKNFGDCVE